MDTVTIQKPEPSHNETYKKHTHTHIFLREEPFIIHCVGGIEELWFHFISIWIPGYLPPQKNVHKTKI